MSEPRRRRVTLYLNPWVLAVLGREANSKSVNGALTEYAEMVEEAGYRLAEELDPKEWNYLRAALELRHECHNWKSGTLRSLLADLVTLAAADRTCEKEYQFLGEEEGVQSLLRKVQGFGRLEVIACFMALAFGLGLLRAGHDIDIWWSPWLRIAATIAGETDDYIHSGEESGT